MLRKRSKFQHNITFHVIIDPPVVMSKLALAALMFCACVAALCLVASGALANELLEKIDAENPAIIKLESGVRIKVLAKGPGGDEARSPVLEDEAEVHYEGSILLGGDEVKKFESTYDDNEPMVLKVNEVIAAFSEVLPLMAEGDKWRIFTPPEQAFGDETIGDGLVPGGSTLMFDIEMLKVVGQGKTAAEAAAAFQGATGKAYDAVEI